MVDGRIVGSHGVPLPPSPQGPPRQDGSGRRHQTGCVIEQPEQPQLWARASECGAVCHWQNTGN